MRVVPQRSAEFDHLPLPALRSYRQTLTAEENRVSYWRRLIQARLDLIALKGETTRFAWSGCAER